MRIVSLCVAVLVLSASPVRAQWDARPTPGLPRASDGKVRLTAPAPRVNGKPDLTGIWHPRPDPEGKPGGVEYIVLPRYMVNVGADVPGPPDSFVQPEFKALFNKRLMDEAADPAGYCKPIGAIRALSLPLPLKIVQAPGLVMVLYESDTAYRQIFTDGRPLPKEPLPTFMGYSVGRWDGDTFVVRSTGYSEQAWLDAMGHPHTEALQVEERYRRIDAGHLDVEVTLSDPKALTRDIAFTQHLDLLPDTDLFEYFCTENEKDAARYTP